MITINTGVVREVNQVNDEGLVLVVFKNARKGSWSSDSTPLFTPESGKTLTRINTLDELKANFGPAADGADEGSTISSADFVDAELRELYVSEYLLRGGVNLYVLTTDVVGTLDADDLTLAEDIDELGYKFILSPYNFVNAAQAYSDAALITFVNGIDAEGNKRDVQLFIDINQATQILAPNDNIISAEKMEIIRGYGLKNAKIEFYYGSDIMDYSSEYISDTTLDYASATGFVGIPASAISVIRKVGFIKAGTPWLPVAGETTGVIPEATGLINKVTVTQKKILQSKNINVLYFKQGVGVLFVSQNTAFDKDAEAGNPLFRSHVVTQALELKRFMKRQAESLLFLPNIQKTWDKWQLNMTSVFSDIQGSDGVEDFTILTGRKYMSSLDIQNGIFKGYISYYPIHLIENVELSILIQQSQNLVDVAINGGLL